MFGLLKVSTFFFKLLDAFMEALGVQEGHQSTTRPTANGLEHF